MPKLGKGISLNMSERSGYNPGETPESHIESIFSVLKNKRESKETRSILREVPGLRETIKDLPEKIQSEVLVSAERLKGYGKLNNDEIIAESEIRAEELRATYIDHRFEVPNQSYLRLEMHRQIDQLIVGQSGIDDVDRLGFLNFDLNGLKSVNDISGHEAGNEFLKRAVNVFQNGKTTKRLEDLGVNVFFTTGGGDEFSILLRGKGDIVSGEGDELSITEQALIDYQKEISKMDCSDLIDFTSKKVVDRFNKTVDIPEGFHFRGTIAGGIATLREAVVSFAKFDHDKNYQQNLDELMGLLFDISNQRIMEDKKDIKEALANGDEFDRFLAKVYKRTEEAVMLETEVQELRDEIESLRVRLAELEDK